MKVLILAITLTNDIVLLELYEECFRDVGGIFTSHLVKLFLVDATVSTHKFICGY